MKFRKKPVIIDAIQWRGPEDDAALSEFIPGNLWCYNSARLPCIKTMESGDQFHIVSPGDWVVKGIEGKFYACKPGIFAASYEKAEEPLTNIGSYVSMLVASYGFENVMNEITAQWRNRAKAQAPKSYPRTVRRPTQEV